MIDLHSSLRLTAIAALLGGLAAQDAAKDALAFRPFDQAAFEAHMQAAGVGAERIEAFRRNVTEESARLAVDHLLREKFAPYRKAVLLAEDADPRAALELTKLIQADTDPYVNAYSRYHLARAFLQSDDPEEAATMLAEFVDNDLNRTPLDSEVVYFYGNALAKIPERRQAIRFFTAFLREFPDAPERLRSSAAQIKAEMLQQEGVLHEISDVMKNVERKIRKTDTGETTQDKQKLVIEELEKIIKMLEQQENQAGGAPGGGGNNPANYSALPGGPGEKKAPNKAPPKVADKWGELKDDERKAIEAELKTRLPPHYRKMLEEYYKKLNGKGGR